MADKVKSLVKSSEVKVTAEFLRSIHRRSRLILGVAALVCLFTILIGVSIGPVYIGIGDVARIILHHITGVPEQTWSDSADTIVWKTRLPRVLMGAAAGATLAMAGAALQAMVRNPLADPYILGVNSGASTGAALVITVFSGGGAFLLSGSAFIGALVSTLMVLMIGGSRRDGGPLRLIMAGMAVGYALSAVTSFLVFASDSAEASRSVMFWLLGSLTNIHWSSAIFGLSIAVLITVLLTSVSGVLDTLAAGDEAALSLGIKPETGRIVLMIIVSLAVGVVVSIAGSIGFVGLVIPHIARALVGNRHRVLIPACALLGAAFLITADIGARMLFAPQEMPIGVVTGVVGAPFLLFLVRNRHAAK